MASFTVILIIGFSTAFLYLPGVLTIPQADAQVSSTNSSLTYRNPTSGISVQYPPDWTKTEAQDGVVFQSPPRTSSDLFREQAGVSVSPSSGNGSASVSGLVNQEISKLE